MKNLFRSLLVVLAFATTGVFAQAAAAPADVPAKVKAHAHGKVAKVAKASKKGHKGLRKKHKKHGKKKSA